MPKLTINPPSQVQHQIRVQQQNRRVAEKLRQENETVRKENFLQSLPVEILAEILSYASLRTVLAVARSCKWLCTTLTHPDQSFIWKIARKRLSPAPPEPPYDVTEPAYAAIICSAGNCPTCGARHVSPPYGFQHRAHFCSKGGQCRGASFSLDRTPLTYNIRGHILEMPPEQISWVGSIGPDGNNALYRDPDAAPHPADHILFPSLYRYGGSVWRAERDQGLKEWEVTQDNPEAFSALLKRWSTRAERMLELCDHDDQWRSWVMRMTTFADYRRLQMEKKIRELTKKFECEPSDLAKCRTFNTLIKRYGRWNEICTDVDWRRQEPQIREELEKNKADHERRKAEHERSLKQVYVEAFHAAAIQSLFPPNSPSGATTSPAPVLPTFEAYRSLPSISNIIHNTSIPAKGLREKLRTDETLRTMIKSDLEKEDARLRKVMSGRLGVKKKWKPAVPPGEGESKDAVGGSVDLHPLDRLTTLFECTRCQADGEGKPASHGDYMALTFEGAVRHRCSRYLPKPLKTGSEEEMGGRAKWDAENFVPDAMGIAVVKLALGLAGLDEETLTRKEVDKLGRRWQCLTCPSNVTMSFGAIVGHAKRHKAMSQPSSTAANEASNSSTSSEVSFSLNFIPKTTPLLPNLPAPLPPGVVLPRSKPKETESSSEDYGCQHCGFARIFGDSAGKLPASGYTPKKFSPDGLASHVFRKHGLAPLRNEDIWVFNAGDDDDESLKDSEKQPSGTSETSQSPLVLESSLPFSATTPVFSPMSHFPSLPSILLWSDDDDVD